MEQFRDELLNYCLSRNIPNPDDVVQDTFVRAIEYWESYENGTNLRAWLYAIMLRTVVPNRARKGARDPLCFVEELWAEDTQPDPEDYASASSIISVILSMDPMYSEILYLRFVMGYSYKEITRTMGLPVGTALSRVHRGRRILQQALK